MEVPRPLRRGPQVRSSPTLPRVNLSGGERREGHRRRQSNGGAYDATAPDRRRPLHQATASTGQPRRVSAGDGLSPQPIATVQSPGGLGPLHVLAQADPQSPMARTRSEGPKSPASGSVGRRRGGETATDALRAVREESARAEEPSLLFDSEMNQAITLEWIRELSNVATEERSPTRSPAPAQRSHGPSPGAGFNSPVVAAFLELQRAGGEKANDAKLIAGLRAVMAASTVGGGLQRLLQAALESLLTAAYPAAEEAREALSSVERLREEGPPRSYLAEALEQRDMVYTLEQELAKARERAAAAESRADGLEAELRETKERLVTARAAARTPMRQRSGIPRFANGDGALASGVGAGHAPEGAASSVGPMTADKVLDSYGQLPPRSKTRTAVLMTLLERDGTLLHSVEGAEAVLDSLDQHDATLLAYKQIVRRPPPPPTKRSLLNDLLLGMEWEEKHDLAMEIVHNLVYHGHNVLDIFQEVAGPEEMKQTLEFLAKSGIVSEDILLFFVGTLRPGPRREALALVLDTYGEQLALPVVARMLGNEGHQSTSAVTAITTRASVAGLVALLLGIANRAARENADQLTKEGAQLINACNMHASDGTDVAQLLVANLGAQLRRDVAEGLGAAGVSVSSPSATPKQSRSMSALRAREGRAKATATRTNSRRSLTVAVAVEFVNRMVAQKVTYDAVDERDGRLPQPALDFITDFFLAKFSLRSVANMYSKGLIRTLERSADEHPRLRTMRLLCGLDLGDDLTHLATKRERMLAWVLASSRGTHRLASFLVQSCTSMPGAAPAEGSGEEGAEVGVAAVMGGSAPADDAAAVGMVPLARAVDLLKTMYPVDGGPVLYRACSVSSELQERIIAELRSAIDNGPDAPPARSVHVDVVVAQAAKAFGLAIAEGRVRAQALFHEFDDDGNGLMDFDEFKTFLNRTMTGREVEERDAIKLFRSLGSLSEGSVPVGEGMEEDMISAEAFARLCETPDMLALAREL